MNDIELRSDSIQEILEHVPIRIIRWGISVIFAIIITSVVTCCFFSYPDTIRSEIMVTTFVPPASVVARSDGEIEKIMVENGDYVLKDEVLLIIENTVNVEHLNKLKTELKEIRLLSSEINNIKKIIELTPNQSLELGIIQNEYVQFLKTINEIKNSVELSVYDNKIKAINLLIGKHRKLLNQLKNESNLLKQSVSLTVSQNKRDSLLYNRNVISVVEIEHSNSEYLQKSYLYETSISRLVKNEIKIAELEQAANELSIQNTEEQHKLIDNMNNSIGILLGRISTWESLYVLKSPVDGTVSLTNIRCKNQVVRTGQRLMTILPEYPGEFAGYLNLASEKSGKVSLGQLVNIKFHGFPYMEYGIVKGIVEEISTIKEMGKYIVKVKLPDGLRTNYGKELDFKQEMVGSADIITDNINLMKRIISPLKYIVKKQEENIAMNLSKH